MEHVAIRVNDQSEGFIIVFFKNLSTPTWPYRYRLCMFDTAEPLSVTGVSLMMKPNPPRAL